MKTKRKKRDRRKRKENNMNSRFFLTLPHNTGNLVQSLKLLGKGGGKGLEQSWATKAMKR
jgi:hypothetical protein